MYWILMCFWGYFWKLFWWIVPVLCQSQHTVLLLQLLIFGNSGPPITHLFQNVLFFLIILDKLLNCQLFQINLLGFRDCIKLMDLEKIDTFIIWPCLKTSYSSLPGLSNSKNFSFIDRSNIGPIHFLLKLLLDILGFLLLLQMMFPSINFLTNY